MTPPPGYLIHCLHVIGALAVGAYVLARIFLWTRDAHKRKER